MKKLHEMGDLAQSILFTLPAAGAMSLIWGMMYLTAYPIAQNVQGEIIALDGDSGCAETAVDCTEVIDEIHLQVGEQVFEVRLKDSFLANAENPPYEIGDRVRTTYRSTRDKEYFGANDAVRQVREYDSILLKP